MASARVVRTRINCKNEAIVFMQEQACFMVNQSEETFNLPNFKHIFHEDLYKIFDKRGLPIFILFLEEQPKDCMVFNNMLLSFEESLSKIEMHMICPIRNQAIKH